MIQQGHKIRFLINCSHSQCIVFSKFSISWLTQSREISELWFLCCHLGTHIKYKNKEIYHLRVKVGSDLGVLILIINQFLEIIRHVNWIRNYFDCQINVTLITLPEINSPNRVPEAAWSPVHRLWIILRCSHDPGPLFPRFCVNTSVTQLRTCAPP